MLLPLAPSYSMPTSRLTQSEGSIPVSMASVRVNKVASSRRRRRALTSQATGKRRGNSGNFTGTRLKFLTDQLSLYQEAAKAKNFKPFWSRLFKM